MSECQNKANDDASNDCTPAAPSVTHVLRASAIVATGVFLAITVVVLLCILHKQRRLSLFACFRTAQARPAPHLPALYVWSPAAPAQAAAVANPAPGKSSKGRSRAVVEPPLSCVIMAGDERPTHLAQPLPTDEFNDVSLDLHLDEQKRGKRKATLNSSLGL